jgi:hypothetical protein
MKLTAVVIVALLMSVTMIWAHDERLHGANVVTGQVVTANADGMELKTHRNSQGEVFEQDEVRARQQSCGQEPHSGGRPRRSHWELAANRRMDGQPGAPGLASPESGRGCETSK